MPTAPCPGWPFGEAALLTGGPRSASVQAKDEVELYALGKEDFQAALDVSLSLKEQLMHIVFQRQ